MRDEDSYKRHIVRCGACPISHSFIIKTQPYMLSLEEFFSALRTQHLLFVFILHTMRRRSSASSRLTASSLTAMAVCLLVVASSKDAEAVNGGDVRRFAASVLHSAEKPINYVGMRGLVSRWQNHPSLGRSRRRGFARTTRA